MYLMIKHITKYKQYSLDLQFCNPPTPLFVFNTVHTRESSQFTMANVANYYQ